LENEMSFSTINEIIIFKGSQKDRTPNICRGSETFENDFIKKITEPPVYKKRDLRDLRDPEGEPDFLWRQISEGEKCELCGKAPVRVEINDIHGRQILRRCLKCFEKMRTELSSSVWRRVGH
jgi:hypothetical protein